LIACDILLCDYDSRLYGVGISSDVWCQVLHCLDILSSGIMLFCSCEIIWYARSLAYHAGLIYWEKVPSKFTAVMWLRYANSVVSRNPPIYLISRYV
jgi:hypothetical protein